MNKLNSRGRTEIEQALSIMKSIGVRRAAGYLRNRRWSIEAALWELLRAEVLT